MAVFFLANVNHAGTGMEGIFKQENGQKDDEVSFFLSNPVGLHWHEAIDISCKKGNWKFWPALHAPYQISRTSQYKAGGSD